MLEAGTGSNNWGHEDEIVFHLVELMRKITDFFVNLLEFLVEFDHVMKDHLQRVIGKKIK